MTNHTTQPLVSIITPVYNHRPFVGTCIESVLAQTYQNWEQIVIDDGSTDGTAEVIARHTDRRIKYLAQQNRGPFELAETYNTALRMAGGELIAILEGDDFWPPQKLATMVASFRDPDVVLAYGEAADVDPGGRTQRRNSRTTRLRQRLSPSVLNNDPVGTATRYMLFAEGRSLVSPSTVIVRRNVLDQIGGFQYVSGLPLTDYPTFMELSLKGRFIYFPETMGYRRRHQGSVTVNHARDIHEKVSEYSLNFMELRSNQVTLGKSEIDAIQESWYLAQDKLNFAEGRTLLLNRRWSDARQHFRILGKSSSPMMRLVGFAGFISSCLHTDIELFMRLGGTAGLRTSR